MYGDLTTYKGLITAPAARESARPREGGRVRRQSHGSIAWSGPAVSSATGQYRPIDGAPVLSEAAYPYWFMLLWGHEPVYRLMLQQQTLALARYIVTGPVRASAWDMTWDDDVKETDAPVQWVKDNILPLRRKVIRDAVRCVDFGWQPFAVQWEIRDGKYVPDVRPLLPDATQVLQDERGNFAGVENQGEKGPAVRLNNLESWAPSLDGEAGYAYGRSRLENVRTTAWAPWLETYIRTKELTEKISGILPIVTHAPNGYEDDDGNYVNYATGANTLLEELPRNRGVRIESLVDPRELLDKDPEVVKIMSSLKAIDVDFYDAGSSSPAVIGFISLLEYWDKQLFRGMLRPERAGLEAVAAGSRADSEQHTETGAADSEAIDADLTESFDEHIVKTALRLNFGEEAARKIHVISTPLLKWKQQVYRELLGRFASVPDIAVSMTKSLDMDSVFAQLSLPQVKKYVFEAAVKPAPTTDPEAPKPKKGTDGAARQDEAKQLAATIAGQFANDGA
jgi:hypothetical protein